MAANLGSDNAKYLLVTPRAYSITNDNFYAVDEAWGYDLNAHLAVFPNLHILAPFDPIYESQTYAYVFSQESTISFHPLPNFKTSYECLKKMPQILAALVRNIKRLERQDLIQSAGGIEHQVGLLAIVLCTLMRHDKRVIVLDADLVEDLEVKSRLEQRVARKLFLIVMKHLVDSVLKFLITITPLTFVVGDSLYSRYCYLGNVQKIYASWTSKTRIISPTDLKKKMLAASACPCVKLVFAASLFPKKGPDIAIKAAAALHKKNVPIILDMYGAGPMYDELLILIKQHNLSDVVRLKGTVQYKDFHRVLTCYDVLLLANLSGEQPRVLFDAMASGVLVVGSDISPLSGVISSGYNGVLCHPGDAESFASAIEHLYLNRKELSVLVYNAALASAPCTIQAMHEQRRSTIKAVFVD